MSFTIVHPERRYQIMYVHLARSDGWWMLVPRGTIVPLGGTSPLSALGWLSGRANLEFCIVLIKLAPPDPSIRRHLLCIRPTRRRHGPSSQDQRQPQPPLSLSLSLSSAFDFSAPSSAFFSFVLTLMRTEKVEARALLHGYGGSRYRSSHPKQNSF